MTLDEVLTKVVDRLDGQVAAEADIARLRAEILAPVLPNWLASLMRRYRLVGSRMSLAEHVDESAIGVELLWLSPRQMISEALEAEPGISVCRLGFWPLGACASGSGDPYFLDLRDKIATDPPLVRVRHDLAGRSAYPPEGLEQVASSLSMFLQRAFSV